MPGPISQSYDGPSDDKLPMPEWAVPKTIPESQATTKEMEEPLNWRCPRCEGSGNYQRLPEDPETVCAVCDGLGVIVEERLDDEEMSERRLDLIHRYGSAGLEDD